MKEVTYEDWQKNPTPRMMWVWDNLFNVKKKAKELIKEMLSILPKENIEGIYEITEEAEQFLNDEVYL